MRPISYTQPYNIFLGMIRYCITIISIRIVFTSPEAIAYSLVERGLAKTGEA
jgi:hypothetical protein